MYNDQILYRIYFDFLKLIQNFSTSGSILYTLNTLIRDKSKLKLHRELGLHGLAWADLSWSNHSNHHTDKNLVSTNSSWTARYIELSYEWISFDMHQHQLNQARELHHRAGWFPGISNLSSIRSHQHEPRYRNKFN